jgi:CubicO group peptidase (beta-lactamase class C family)
MRAREHRFLPIPFLLLCGFLSALSALAGAQPLPEGDAQALGFSPQRLARIDAYMQDAVDEGVMVGGEALIARRGQIAYRAQWGLRDREAGEPVSEDTLYRIYSMTKPITSVALLMLYEEGHFQLEDPIAMHLPEFAGLKVLEPGTEGAEDTLRAPARPPTIRDLMRHTAGMTYGVFGDSPVDRAYREADLLRAPDLETFTRRLAGLPLQYDPGQRWHYSVSVDLQGRLVEVFSGMDFASFLRTRIFEPLGMEDTFFVVPAAKQPRLAQLYSPEGTEVDWNAPWQLNRSQALEVADPQLSEPFIQGSVFPSGGGGLVSSTGDYLRFAQMLLDGGELEGVRLLSPHTVAHMRRNHIAGMEAPGLRGIDGFGLGVAVLMDPGVTGQVGSPGAFGWGGAAGTRFWIDPHEGLIGLFMVQSLPHQTQLGDAFRTLVYQALVD